jgi:hypothetical protein
MLFRCNFLGLEPDIIGIDWYDGSEGYADVNAPTLAIAFQCGRVQISRGEHDDNPQLIDANMTLSQCKWNSNGSVLALAGSQSSQTSAGDQRDVSMVQFYDPQGTHLRSLKVPGSGISDLTWEGGGLRIALAVDSYIYFANIRPDYKWGYFANTLVYSYNKPDRSENVVVFWDTNSGERCVLPPPPPLPLRRCSLLATVFEIYIFRSAFAPPPPPFCVCVCDFLSSVLPFNQPIKLLCLYVLSFKIHEIYQEAHDH